MVLLKMHDHDYALSSELDICYVAKLSFETVSIQVFTLIFRFAIYLRIGAYPG